MDYKELVEPLRFMAKQGKRYGMAVITMEKAADAIEELSRKYTEERNAAVELTGELASKPRWIPVTERLPEPGVPCLCWCKGGTYGQIRWYGLYYLTSHRTWAFYDNDCTENKEVTHWMYRPEPPKEEEE